MALESSRSGREKISIRKHSIDLTRKFLGECNSRHINGKVPTYKNLLDPILVKIFGKKYLCWKNQAKDVHDVTAFH